MKNIWLFIVLLGVTGCAAELRWEQEGKTAAQEEEDYFQCEDKLLREHDNFIGLSDKEIDKLMDECMKEKGYRVAS